MYAQKKPCCAGCADGCNKSANGGFGNRPVLRTSNGMQLGQWEWIGPALSAAVGIGTSIYGADQQRQMQHTQEDAIKAQIAAINQLQTPAAVSTTATLPPSYPVAPVAASNSNLLIYGALGVVGILALTMLARR